MAWGAHAKSARTKRQRGMAIAANSSHGTAKLMLSQVVSCWAGEIAERKKSDLFNKAKEDTAHRKEQSMAYMTRKIAGDGNALCAAVFSGLRFAVSQGAK